jgi:hypothetical protein
MSELKTRALCWANFGCAFLKQIHRDCAGLLRVLPKRLLRQDYAIALTLNSPLREHISVVLLQKIREKAWQDKIIQYLGE